MPLDDLPSALLVPTRDQARDKYLRDYGLRKPGADVSTTSQPFIDASTHADGIAPVLANAITIANFVSGKNKGGAALVEEARRFGTGPLPAAGASGFVTISASAGGTTIEFGDEIRNLATGLRYSCAATALYLSGASVPVSGIDTGPLTDVAAGTTLTWTSPRPGCGTTAIVAQQADGTGLSGGRDLETDQQLDERLVTIRSTPAASGNDAEFQQAIVDTPGQSIGLAFTYPCILGPGSTAFAFLLNASGVGRIPNAAQIAAVLAWLNLQFPADDSILGATVASSPVNLALQINWADNATGWTDANPWPQFASSGPVVGTVTSSTVFNVNAVAGDVPQVGQTFAVFDPVSQKFYRKRVLTAVFVSGTTYTITCDTTNAASDTTFTPTATQLVCPWSDSLQSLVPAVQGYFDAIGTGEMVTPLPDPGARQRRSPSSTNPSVLTRRIVAPVDDLDTVGDSDVYAPTLPYATPVGSPGTLVYVLIISSLGAYP